MRDLEFSNEMTFHDYSASDGIVWNDLHTGKTNTILKSKNNNNNKKVKKNQDHYSNSILKE